MVDAVSDKFSAAFTEFKKSMVEEIERQTSLQKTSQGQNLEWLAEQYIQLSQKVKAKSVIVTRELAEMIELFKSF